MLVFVGEAGAVRTHKTAEAVGLGGSFEVRSGQRAAASIWEDKVWSLVGTRVLEDFFYLFTAVH